MPHMTLSQLPNPAAKKHKEKEKKIHRHGRETATASSGKHLVYELLSTYVHLDNIHLLALMNPQPSLSEIERTFYAALVPCPHTSSVLKAACRTWEDHLWAQISIMCEEKEVMELTKLEGCFWEGGAEGVEKGVKEMSAIDEECEEQDWANEVTETLESLKGIVVTEG